MHWTTGFNDISFGQSPRSCLQIATEPSREGGGCRTMAFEAHVQEILRFVVQ